MTPGVLILAVVLAVAVVVMACQHGALYMARMRARADGKSIECLAGERAEIARECADLRRQMGIARSDAENLRGRLHFEHDPAVQHQKRGKP